MKDAARTAAALVLLAVTGCTHHYTPSPSRRFEPIPEFSSTNSVTLQNAQTSTENVVFFRKGVHTWYANLREWTNVAIAIARRELTDRGMVVVDQSPRVLRLSVRSVKTEADWTRSETEIVLAVETAENYSATYVGRNSAVMAIPVERQNDGAIMRAVVEMFKDSRLTSYLTR